jgi:hypothetical protein
MADELEVLLEPEREQERRRARRSARFRYIGRMALAALLLVASGGALFAYSKRQTIRLASELDRARAEGAASFGHLDTCIASHQLAQREATACRDAKSRQEEEYRAKLRQLGKSGTSEAAFARQMQALESTYTTRVKSCEEEKAFAARAREAQEQQLTWDWQRKETQLMNERDEQHRVVETRTRELDRCRADLVTQSRPPANVDHSTVGESLGAPSSVGETPSSGSAPKRLPAPAPEPSPFGPAPAEGTLNTPHPSSAGPPFVPAAAAANW